MSFVRVKETREYVQSYRYDAFPKIYLITDHNESPGIYFCFIFPTIFPCRENVAAEETRQRFPRRILRKSIIESIRYN